MLILPMAIKFLKSLFEKKIFFSIVIITFFNNCDSSVNNVLIKKPNILLISVDDLNDWIGVMGGHPQMETPNIDRLASRGILFTNANCQSPVCNPSRASMMTSLYPSSTGIYFLNPPLERSDKSLESTVMPQRFLEEGYDVFGAGKLFHNKKENKKYINKYWDGFGEWFGPLSEKKISDFDGDARLWDWGSLDIEDEESEDCQIANWAVNILSEDNKKPFWLGVGFFKPHVPFIAPKKWFDQYPIESIQLPEIIDGDLNDISEYAKSLSRYGHVAPSHKWVVSNNQWRSLVRSYLACVSFVDDQVGKVLDALERSDKVQNTYVILYSDHGFHLGEKEKWAKRSLWKNSTKVPLIISGPGIPKGKTCDLPVQLLDIYPTLLELSGLASDPIHQGNSLVPILKKGVSEWPYVARTSIGPGNYSIVSKNYRFIQYNDNTAELYDRINDPNEWYNLINNPDLSDVIEEHRNKIPNQRHEILGDGSLGHESYSFSEKGILDPN